MLIIAYLIFINLLTFAAFAKDKAAAVNREWRISEANLQFLALLGGSPMAIFAVHSLRHKISKDKFMDALYLIVGFQIIVIALFLSEAITIDKLLNWAAGLI